LIATGRRRQRQLRCAQCFDARLQVFKMPRISAAEQADNHHSPVRLNAVLVNAGDDTFEIGDTKIIAFA
jgi:hypothetical protein